MLSALDVATFFLRRPEDEELSLLKLQKLLYYAQGFHLAEFNEPLFEEPIYAWRHGPVVRSIWDRYKTDYSGGKSIPAPEQPIELTDTVSELLEDVWITYGQFSAWRLRELSHESAPWKNVDINDVISHDSMRAWFLTQLTVT